MSGMSGRAAPSPIVETTSIHEIFADGMELEDSAEIVRLTYWAAHGGERIMVDRIVMTTAAYHRMLKQMIGTPTMLS